LVIYPENGFKVREKMLLFKERSEGNAYDWSSAEATSNEDLKASSM